MGDEFSEWDRFSEILEGCITIEGAMEKYRRMRRQEELAKYAEDRRRYRERKKRQEEGSR